MPGESSVQRQTHLLEERGVARVALQVLQQRVAFRLGETAVALGVGPLQPLERLVGLPTEGLHLCNLEGPFCMVFRDILHQDRVRFLLPPQGVIRERLPLQAEGNLRLPLDLGQRLLRKRPRLQCNRALDAPTSVVYGLVSWRPQRASF